MGEEVHLVAGLYENVKITTPEDLFLAEYRLKNGG
jgi:2-C-methyl-D-erythritol 4-phosphate cytidylyltransferase